MKLIVTGCFGFIGYNFINYLLNSYPDEFQIIGVDNLNNNCSVVNKNNLLNKNFTHINLNINDINQLKNEGVDLIVNFAAESHVDNSISNPASFVNTNTLGTLSLLNYAKLNNIKRFIQISTDEIYGSSKEKFFDESDRFNPSSPYSASKASAEHLCNAFRNTYDQNIVIVRPCNNYGIFQQPEKLIPFSILNLINNKNIEIYGDGKNIRNWIHVNDTSSALIHIIQNGFENDIFNISTDFFINNYELGKKIIDLMKLDEERISYVNDRPGHDFRYATNNNYLVSTGWQPKYDFNESLREIIEWYIQNNDWWESEYHQTVSNRLDRLNLK